MKLCVLPSLLLFACGQATHIPSSSEPTGGAPSGAEGDAGARDAVLAPMTETLPTCAEASLEVTGLAGTENWSGDPLLFPTSWQTFRAYAMRGPIDAITGIWSTGPLSAPFLDREVRPLTSLLVAAEGELLCASGKRRALRNGAYAEVEAGALGPLTCSGDVVPGQLRYCHDCQQGGSAITGDLDGDAVLEVTGAHSRAGDTLFLQMGWGVLIAHFNSDADGESLRDGAYLSFSNQVYCFDSAAGDARNITTADITFTGFRRADTCQAAGIHDLARACVKQFEPGGDW